jgi:acyl-CoA thioesterase-2
MTEDTPGVSLAEATLLVEEDGGYSARLSPAWEIWGPNGGYLAALALRAAGTVAEIARPASFYCHFLRSPDFDRVELDVDFLKRGRRSESLAVRMTQRGVPVLHALVRTAADAAGHELQQARAPDVPGPRELRSIEQLGAQDERAAFAFWENVERRPLDQRRPLERNPDTASRPALVREWARLRPEARFEDPFLEASRSLILLDTYGWPALYRKFGEQAHVAPNLDTSAWFHRLSPASEWLLIEHECLTGHDGLLGVSGRVWSEDGRLVATGSAQLCCLPAAQP